MPDDKSTTESTVISLSVERAKTDVRHIVLQWAGTLRSIVDDAETIGTMQGRKALETTNRRIDDLEQSICNQLPFDVYFVELLESLELVRTSFVALNEAMKSSGPYPITTTFFALARPAAEHASDELGAGHIYRRSNSMVSGIRCSPRTSSERALRLLAAPSRPA